ncbi:MAG: hypothetical protein IPK82_08085 [Polyangiaceae bacterium]|nr:hypothetical protein [Polyangiaceae bacterium]
MAKVSRAPQQDEPPDIFDVPAAVLCARCGQPDCMGCEDPSDNEGSGVVAIVPWERPGGTWQRLWATARATTLSADTFFAALPDGPVRGAITFALLAEFLAVGSMVALIVPLVALVMPQLAAAVVSNPVLRDRLIFLGVVGVPALSIWMAVAHAAHGVALDAGARRNGARPQRRRAIRFGLYACGWDLMSGPLGALAAAFSEGGKAAGQALSASVRVPARAAGALLSGVYSLAPAPAARARKWASRAAGVVTVVSAIVVLVFAVILYKIA